MMSSRREKAAIALTAPIRAGERIVGVARLKPENTELLIM